MPTWSGVELAKVKELSRQQPALSLAEMAEKMQEAGYDRTAGAASIRLRQLREAGHTDVGEANSVGYVSQTRRVGYEARIPLDRSCISLEKWCDDQEVAAPPDLQPANAWLPAD